MKRDSSLKMVSPRHEQLHCDDLSKTKIYVSFNSLYKVHIHVVTIYYKKYINNLQQKHLLRKGGGLAQ